LYVIHVSNISTGGKLHTFLDKSARGRGYQYYFDST